MTNLEPIRSYTNTKELRSSFVFVSTDSSYSVSIRDDTTNLSLVVFEGIQTLVEATSEAFKLVFVYNSITV